MFERYLEMLKEKKLKNIEFRQVHSLIGKKVNPHQKEIKSKKLLIFLKLILTG